MKRLRKLGVGLFAVLAAAFGFIALFANWHPSMEPYRDLVRTAPGAGTSGFTVTWLGVSTLLFDDGETAFMTDGFFTRPGKFASAALRISPDGAAIDAGLKRAGVTHLTAVIAVHSHYDHAMDSAVVAARTGALLVGSASTANIGRGAGLAEDRIVVARPGEVLKLGKYSIRFFDSRHAPSSAPLAGEIAAPLAPPAYASAYREGGCYTLLVEHGDRSVLVQGSAGFLDGALRGVHADVVYLGVGLLGRQTADYRTHYWDQLVRGTGAQRVIPIHWDDFWRPLDAPVRPMPRLVDDFDASMRFLIERAHREHVDLELPQLGLRADPYAGQ